MKKITIGILLALIWLSVDGYAQCAMCRSSVESSIANGSSNVGMGLNTGILMLLVIPYLCFAAIAYSWYRSSRANQRERKLDKLTVV